MNTLTPPQSELRERMLDLAISTGNSDVIGTARRFIAFVTGESDMSPREKINAAMDQADVR